MRYVINNIVEYMQYMHNIDVHGNYVITFIRLFIFRIFHMKKHHMNNNFSNLYSYNSP